MPGPIVGAMTTPPDPVIVPAATPDSVRAMAIDSAAEGVRIGQRAARVSDATLEQWIAQATGIVRSRARRILLLPATPVADKPWVLTQGRVEAEVIHLVELYAASLLMDVIHPERARTGDSPGAPLMDRFTKLLDQLVVLVDGAIGDGDGGEAGGPVADPMPAAYFPPPLLSRTQGF